MRLVFFVGISLSLLSACLNSAQEEKDRLSRDKVLTFRDQFFAVAAIGPDHVWIVGDLGIILHSSSGGKRWIEQESGTNKSLLGVDFVDPAYGWLVGDSGLILHTSDGGSRWQQQMSGTERRLMSVDFFDTQQGLASGVFGTILRTVDGGETWDDHSLDEDVVLNKVVFISGTKGWIVGEFGTILKTLDGGLTWIRQNSSIQNASLFGVSFMNEEEGWAVGQDGVVLFTRDGGDHWQRYSEKFSKSLFEVVVSRQRSYIVGADGLVLERHGDWKLSDRIISFSWLRGIAMSGKTGWMVGDRGMILKTADHGESWVFVTPK